MLSVKHSSLMKEGRQGTSLKSLDTAVQLNDGIWREHDRTVHSCIGGHRLQHVRRHPLAPPLSDPLPSLHGPLQPGEAAGAGSSEWRRNPADERAQVPVDLVTAEGWVKCSNERWGSSTGEGPTANNNQARPFIAFKVGCRSDGTNGFASKRPQG